MKKTITTLFITIITALGIFTAIPTPTAFADSSCTDICNCTTVDEAVRQAAGCKNASSDSSLASTIKDILNVVIGVLGIVAVIFIVVGGVRYMTSSGDPTKTKKARDTILYACIGLGVCALSFAIVNWVVGIL